MSSGSVSGPTKENVVRSNVSRQAENPVPKQNGFAILEEWSAAGMVALLSTPGQAAANHASSVLPLLADSLVQHYFRLERAVRTLEAQVRLKNRGGAWKATRQIELERQRLGRELHTGVGQMLAAVRLQLELILAYLPDPPAPVRQALERISILLRNALEEVRSVSKRLHPPDWQKLTLEGAVRLLWETSGIPEKYQASLEIDPFAIEPDLNRKVLVYRCLQEALSNVARHARPQHVKVSLKSAGEDLVLTVIDDGVGFDAARLLSSAPSASSGIGLRAALEHAATVGARLIIQSGPLGTKLELSIPVPAN